MEQYKGLVLSEIDPARGTADFTDGTKLRAGEAVGDVSPRDMRRIQIRETILSHFEKEEKLFNMGVKPLSLFFIDEVAKYRDYDAEGHAVLGEYGKIFEEEYKSIWKERLRPEDTPYQRYLRTVCGDAAAAHAGYFSIDKRTGRSIDSRPAGEASFPMTSPAYDLILKDKERLLSFSEPTRFLFSAFRPAGRGGTIPTSFRSALSSIPTARPPNARRWGGGCASASTRMATAWTARAAGKRCMRSMCSR